MLRLSVKKCKKNSKNAIFLSLRTSFEINANKALFFEYLFFCYLYIQIPNEASSLQSHQPVVTNTSSTNFSTFSQRVNRYVLGFSRHARRQKDSLDHGVRLERRRISGSAIVIYSLLYVVMVVFTVFTG